MKTWPDGAMTPFRSEKNTNSEGAFRIPLLVRGPGTVPAGFVTNEIVLHHDWLPTFLALAGEPDIAHKLLKGYEAGGRRSKVHIDGYDLLPFLAEKGMKSPRKGFIYFSDDGDLVAARFDKWKVVFTEQRRTGTLVVWSEPCPGPTCSGRQPASSRSSWRRSRSTRHGNGRRPSRSTRRSRRCRRQWAASVAERRGT